jgi:hypothetical protein
MLTFLMHPSEMKNQALVAAARAQREGFTATAEAMLLLAQACVNEARELETEEPQATNRGLAPATFERVRIFDVIH